MSRIQRVREYCVDFDDMFIEAYSFQFEGYFVVYIKASASLDVCLEHELKHILCDSRARKRVSIARHARLMDYHIYQGHQASTLLAVELESEEEIDLVDTNAEHHLLQVQTQDDSSTRIVYSTRKRLPYMTLLLIKLTIYTWEGIYPVLKAGSNSADLQIDGVDSISNVERTMERE